MKKTFFLLLFSVLGLFSFANNGTINKTHECAYRKGTVVLTPQRHMAHFMLGGTTKCSGRNSAIYLAYEGGFGLQTAGDEYTFKSELCFSFAFDDEDSGRGKILNVSDDNYLVTATFYDLYGNVVGTSEIEISPRTFSRISVGNYNGPISKIECRIR